MKRIAFFIIMMAFGSIGIAQAGDPVAGKQKADACMECHGENGTPGREGVPKIDRMAPDTFVAAIKKMQEVHHDAPISAHALNDEDIADIAAYFTFSK